MIFMTVYLFVSIMKFLATYEKIHFSGFGKIYWAVTLA
jgi:hypothetical protein